MESLNLNKDEKSQEGAPEFKSLREPDTGHGCEYRDEIWQYLLKQESEKPPFSLQSPQLEFRGALVQLLRDITKKLGLNIATLHTAVALLDSFMEAHSMRADRLTHVALACISLASKSEEKRTHETSLKNLSKTAGVKICGKIFRQLEWMVGQHVRWRLLFPTPVTYATLLARYIVVESDLNTRDSNFVRKITKDAAMLLVVYLNLTLSDVRLKVMETVDVGCACVACARADLGFTSWPMWLANLTDRKAKTVAPIARLLRRMLETVNSSKSTVKSDEDISSQVLDATASMQDISLVLSSCSQASSCREQPNSPVFKIGDSTSNLRKDVTCHKVNNYAEYMYSRSCKLIEASLGTGQSNMMAVKRSMDVDDVIDKKRFCLGTNQDRRLHNCV